MSRTVERVDRDESVDDMREVFACLFPLAPARPEAHMRIGNVGPSRRAPSDRLSYSAPSQRLEHVAHRGDYRYTIFHI
jgi:hypothetical protein